MRSPAVRLTGIAIATALTVFFGWFAVLAVAAVLGPDGTWFDGVGFLACTLAALGCGALALGGTR